MGKRYSNFYNADVSNLIYDFLADNDCVHPDVLSFAWNTMGQNVHTLDTVIYWAFGYPTFRSWFLDEFCEHDENDQPLIEEDYLWVLDL